MNIADLSEIINSEIIDEKDEKIVNKYTEIINQGFKLSSVDEEVIICDRAHGGFIGDKNDPEYGKYSLSRYNECYSIFTFEDELGNHRYIIVDGDGELVNECLSKLKASREHIIFADFNERFNRGYNYAVNSNVYDISEDSIYQISASLKKGVAFRTFIDKIINNTLVNMEYANAYAEKYGLKTNRQYMEFLKKIGINFEDLNMKLKIKNKKDEVVSVDNKFTVQALNEVVRNTIEYTIDEILMADEVSICPSFGLMNNKEKRLIIDKINDDEGKKWLKKCLTSLRIDKDNKVKKFVPANKVVDQILTSIRSFDPDSINLDNLSGGIIAPLAAINSLSNLDDAEKEIFQFDFLEKVLTSKEPVNYKQYAYLINNLRTPIEVLNPEYTPADLQEKVKTEKTSAKKKLNKKLVAKRAPKLADAKLRRKSKSKSKPKVNVIDKVAKLLVTKDLKDFVSIEDGKIKIDLHTDLAGLMIDRRPITMKNCELRFEPTKTNENNVNLYIETILRESFTAPGISDYIDELKKDLSLDELINVNNNIKSENTEPVKNEQQTL